MERSQLPEPQVRSSRPGTRTMKQPAGKDPHELVSRVGNQKKDLCAQTFSEPLVLIRAPILHILHFLTAQLWNVAENFLDDFTGSFFLGSALSLT